MQEIVVFSAFMHIYHNHDRAAYLAVCLNVDMVTLMLTTMIVVVTVEWSVAAIEQEQCSDLDQHLHAYTFHCCFCLHEH